jgi:hypothetical protein
MATLASIMSNPMFRRRMSIRTNKRPKGPGGLPPQYKATSPPVPMRPKGPGGLPPQYKGRPMGDLEYKPNIAMSIPTKKGGRGATFLHLMRNQNRRPTMRSSIGAPSKIKLNAV